MGNYKELIHGGDTAGFQTRLGGRDFIDFSANINPLGQPESVRHALRNCGAACERYPDQLCRALTDAIARYEDMPPEWILCGNGAADLIYRAVSALRPKTALLPCPTFAEYEQALAAADCSIRRCLLKPENGFHPDESILDAVPGADIVFLCNPNNPTGTLFDSALMIRILRCCAESGAVLVADECFLDFLADGEEFSLKKYLDAFQNLVILRAFTKMFAIPGVRLGYALVSGGKIRERMAHAAAPWSVSVPAQLCGIAAAGERDFVKRTQSLIPLWREALAEGLRGLGFTVFPGAANYLLFSARQPDLAEKLCEQGIFIRNCDNFYGMPKGFFRVAVRTEEENNKLLRAVSLVLKKSTGG